MSDTSASITAEDLDSIMEGGLSLPPEFLRRGKAPRALHEMIASSGSLGPEHVRAANAHVDSGEELGIRPPDLKAIRYTHHRLAQLLAGGMDETTAERLCNYTRGRASVLKNDPAFAELIAHYTGEVNEEFSDFISAASALRQDMLGGLQQLLDEHPEKFGPGHYLDAIKVLADRTGHAPVNKSVSLNVNMDMAQRLRAASARRDAASGTALPLQGPNT